MAIKDIQQCHDRLEKTGISRAMADFVFDEQARETHPFTIVMAFLPQFATLVTTAVAELADKNTGRKFINTLCDELKEKLQFGVAEYASIIENHDPKPPSMSRNERRRAKKSKKLH